MGPKIALTALGFALLALTCLILWASFLRDTWESDHRSEVIRLSEEVVDLTHAKRLTEGTRRYDELIRLIGDRKLKDPGCVRAVAEARDVVETTRRKLQEEQRLAEKRQKEAEAVSKLRGLESQARAFVDAGQLEQGIGKYQQALEVIKDTQSDNAELVASVDRISQAKAFASATLEKKRKWEEAERTRIEEEKRIASLKAHVKGGAWLTKKAGNSEPLRGLKILVIRSPGTSQQYLGMMLATIDGLTSRLAQDKATMARDEGFTREFPDNEHLQIAYRLSKLLVLREERLLTSLQEGMAVVAKAGDNAPADMANIFGMISPRATGNETKVWAAICSQQLAGTVHTDVDGKYSVEIPGGRYYLYAAFESAYSNVAWFLPVRGCPVCS